MRFWDASALVPLCLEQTASGRARDLFLEDPDMVAWWGSAVECASAFARLRREGALTRAEEERCLRLFDRLRSAWYEVVPGEPVRRQAFRLLRLHSLRAADALQLAAAMEWAGSPGSGEIVTFDQRLEEAGRLEGLVVSGLEA